MGRLVLLIGLICAGFTLIYMILVFVFFYIFWILEVVLLGYCSNNRIEKKLKNIMATEESSGISKSPTLDNKNYIWTTKNKLIFILLVLINVVDSFSRNKSYNFHLYSMHSFYFIKKITYLLCE